jgi:hypothetical protein
MYLVDSGSQGDVTSISSVSGGSMTNGFIAQSTDFRMVSGPEFQRTMTPFVHRLATKGTLQGRAPTRLDKISFLVPLLLLGLFALPRSNMENFVIYVIAVAVWAGIALPWLFATLSAMAYVVVLMVSLVVALVWPWVVPISSAGRRGATANVLDWLASPPGRLVLFVVSIVAWGWVAAFRGAVCRRAFRTTLFSPQKGRPTLLKDIAANGIDHVFCATDLQSAEQVYFGNDFIYGYRFGKGRPGDLRLYDAVQASANLPFGFPPRRIKTGGHGFEYLDKEGRCPEQDDRPDPYPPRAMVLTDGGVYDNMADQWPQGFAGRADKCWPTLRTEHNEPKVLIVANASAGLEWQTMRRSRIPLFGEIAALLKIKSVLYDQTTAHRRSAMIGQFARAELEGRGLKGALLNISQSPYKVADAYAKTRKGSWRERGRRSRQVIALLGDDCDRREAWKKVAKEDAAVGTVLSALGVDVSGRLLHHAYLLAMATCHVILGYPLPQTLPPKERFENMARGNLEETPSWTFVQAEDPGPGGATAATQAEPGAP